MTSPHAGSTIAAPPLPNTSRSGSSTGKSSGNALRWGRLGGDVLGTRPGGDVRGQGDQDPPGLIRDVAHRGQPAVGGVGGRPPPARGGPRVAPPARERHAVLPADQPADAAERR